MSDLTWNQPDPAALETLTAEVFVHSRSDSETEQVFLDLLFDTGVTAQVRVVPPHRGFDQLTWLLLAVLPLQAFLSEFGKKLGEDSSARLQAAVRRLADRDGKAAEVDRASQSGGRPTLLVFQDAATGLQVVLEPDLPAEAYRQLTALDLAQFRIGPLHYDQTLRRWRSELDEASRAPRMTVIGDRSAGLGSEPC